MDGDFASTVELVKLRKNAYTVTHLSNSKIKKSSRRRCLHWPKNTPWNPRKSVMNYYFTVDSHHRLLRFLKSTSSYWNLPRKGGAGMSLRVTITIYTYSYEN
ncbi:hypothetical protein Patl1_14306 [Pistacia atlantica]|uniref:Uncharacterized protein n=1 Tax=Pistacia atlantica TaxID=434234 RepID=A0ACC1AWJ4_9ROSI|nr:hypothetical protein Patl1_14306 [Pistacia atlantica]